MERQAVQFPQSSGEAAGEPGTWGWSLARGAAQQVTEKGSQHPGLAQLVGSASVASVCVYLLLASGFLPNW